MADKNSLNGAAEQENLSQLLQIRRDKLKQLQESGSDPFQITRFVINNDSANIKENFDALEGKEVVIAGVRPWNFSGRGSRDLLSKVTVTTRTDISPRWVRKTTPFIPTMSPMSYFLKRSYSVSSISSFRA